MRRRKQGSAPTPSGHAEPDLVSLAPSSARLWPQLTEDEPQTGTESVDESLTHFSDPGCLLILLEACSRRLSLPEAELPDPSEPWKLIQPLVQGGPPAPGNLPVGLGPLAVPERCGALREQCGWPRLAPGDGVYGRQGGGSHECTGLGSRVCRVRIIMKKRSKLIPSDSGGILSAQGRGGTGKCYVRRAI